MGIKIDRLRSVIARHAAIAPGTVFTAENSGHPALYIMTDMAFGKLGEQRAMHVCTLGAPPRVHLAIVTLDQIAGALIEVAEPISIRPGDAASPPDLNVPIHHPPQSGDIVLLPGGGVLFVDDQAGPVIFDPAVGRTAPVASLPHQQSLNICIRKWSIWREKLWEKWLGAVYGLAALCVFVRDDFWRPKDPEKYYLINLIPHQPLVGVGMFRPMRPRALSPKGVSGARPGMTTRTRTPSGASSSATDSVKAFTAALLAV